jgi:CD36 family
MWTQRTPEEFLFKYVDPLLTLLQRSPNGAIFPQNYSTPQAAYESDPGRIRLHTGQDNVALSKRYIEWEGTENLQARGNSFTKPGYWCNTDQPVTGFFDTNFPPAAASAFSLDPYVTTDSILDIFVTEIYRTVNISFMEDSNVKGIDTLRFRIDPDLFPPNHAYSMNYTGVMNLTCPEGGKPVYVTLPHFLHAQVPPRLQVTGVTKPVTEEHETMLDLDPITGATLRGYSRLQINFMIPKGLGGVPQEKLIPILWIEKYEALSESQAHTYKKQVTDNIKLRHGLFYGLVIGGSTLSLLSLAAFIFAKKKSPHASYDPVWEGAAGDSAMTHPSTERNSDDVYHAL